MICKRLHAEAEVQASRIMAKRRTLGSFQVILGHFLDHSFEEHVVP